MGELVGGLCIVEILAIISIYPLLIRSPIGSLEIGVALIWA
jgi:hypothetical protein